MKFYLTAFSELVCLHLFIYTYISGYFVIANMVKEQVGWRSHSLLSSVKPAARIPPAFCLIVK